MLREMYEKQLAEFGPDDPGTKVLKASLDKRIKASLGRQAQMALRAGFPAFGSVDSNGVSAASSRVGKDKGEPSRGCSEVRQAMDKPWPREAVGRDGVRYRFDQTGALSWEISFLTDRGRWKRDVEGGFGVIQYWARRRREAGDTRLPRRLGIFVGGGEYKRRRSMNSGGIIIERQDRLTDDSGGPGRSRLRWFTTTVRIWPTVDGSFEFHGTRNSPGFNGHSFSGHGDFRSLSELSIALQRHAVSLGREDRRVLAVIRQIRLDRRAEEEARLSSGADQPKAE